MEVLPATTNRKEEGRKNLTNDERKTIYEILLRLINNGEIKKGMFTNLAHQFFISSDTIRRVWAHGKEGIDGDVSSQMQGNVGRKKLLVDQDKIKQVNWRTQTNLRPFAKCFGGFKIYIT